MAGSTDCLTQERIHMYLAGELDQDEAYIVETHLADCELCTSAVEGIRQYVEGHTWEMLDNNLNDLRERILARKNRESLSGMPEEKRGLSTRMWTFLGVAASIVILIGIGGGINYLVQQRNRKIAQAEMKFTGETAMDRSTIQYLPAPKDQVYTEVEELPTFPGGDEALNKFLSETISCPSDPGASAFMGSSMFVHFVVEEDGTITNVKLVVETGDGCTEEALRGVKSMPKWTPGKNGGEAVRVGYILMLKFS